MSEVEKKMSEEKEDKVNHPKHYTSHPSGVECIEITEHYNFCIGNAIKYLWRQGLKSEEGMDDVEKQIEDCKKAIWYIQRQIKGLESSIEEVVSEEAISEALSNYTGTLFGVCSFEPVCPKKVHVNNTGFGKMVFCSTSNYCKHKKA